MSTSQSTAYQSEVMNMMSFVKSEETFRLMKKVMADFFSKAADNELMRLWNEDSLNDSRIEEFRNLHERTPYV